MSRQKKFGAFDGVFTPSILTILGVIMYLRMGWVVGNAGLWGSVFIVLIANIISISTGLSISSIATDKKVGVGGVYYMLSRSLGLPIGGAIGLTLFVGTALSISLYLVGFSESFNAYLGLETDTNGLRSTGSLFLLLLTILAFISTSIAIKTQFIILAAIILSLISVFLGARGPVTDWVPAFGGEGTASMETVFAVFFPAVTGFTAGVAMSGDLKNPKKDIPFGTIAAIAVGFCVYIGLAVFLGLNVDRERLLTDYNILTKIALFGPAVIAGIWGATLSSAIGGILGAPRILQAMSIDRISPRIFARGAGLSNEPRNALLLTVLISEAGILIGELNLIARIVSMFYLAAYGFINISFFLESWASSDFKPSFKVTRWVGLVGFIATFAVMFKLDMVAMILAFVIIGGVFLWLQRKQISLGTGDVWQSVWSTVVKSGLKRMEVAEDHKRNWKPNVMLFSGNTEARPHLVEFAKSLAGQVGMVTNFDLVENTSAGALFPKQKQNVSDELLQRYGIFGRRIEVNNVYKGIETIATTFGFSGLDPNTILMGWAKNTQNPIWFAQMTEKLISLDYNVLYLDYDKRYGFQKREQIDMWWRGVSNNAELMLHLARFLSASPEWRNARIRVLLVNNFNIDRRIIENRIQLLLEEFRVQAEIKVFNNAVEQKPFYELMKTISAQADLVFIGIPNIKAGEEAAFVKRTNELVGVIRTTLLVKASSTFETTELGLKNLAEKPEYEPDRNGSLVALQLPDDEALAGLIENFDKEMGDAAGELCQGAFSVIQQHYRQWLADLEQRIAELLEQITLEPEAYYRRISQCLEELTMLSQQFQTEELNALERLLAERIEEYRHRRSDIIAGMPVAVTHPDKSGKAVKAPLRQALATFHANEGEEQLLEILYAMGVASAQLLVSSSQTVRAFHQELCRQAGQWENGIAPVPAAKKKLAMAFQQLRRRTDQLVETPATGLRNADRTICNRLIRKGRTADLKKAIRNEQRRLKRRAKRQLLDNIQQYHQFWSRNQRLFHNRFEIGVQLTRTACRLNERKARSIEELHKGFAGKILEEIRQLQQATVLAGEWMRSGGDKDWNDIPVIREETDHDNTDAVLWRFIESIKQLNQALPARVELMASESHENMRQEQGKDVQTVNLSIGEITNYLIGAHFSSPFQEQLALLRQQLNRCAERVYNHSSLIGYGLDRLQQEHNYREFDEILEKSQHELAGLADAVDTVFSTFDSEVKERFEATESLLKVDTMLRQAEELSQYIRKNNQRQGLNAWVQREGARLAALQEELAAFIAQKRADVATANFEKLEEKLLGDRDRLQGFGEIVSPDPAVKERLPFYYRQLFSGKHLSMGRKAISRATELAKVRKGLHYHQEGIRGGIMITGEPLSGKSFFMEYAARQLKAKKLIRVLPPPGGASTVQSLQRAFGKASGQRGTIATTLQQLPAGSCVLLEDIELWWLRQEKGRRAIDELIDTIVDFSASHYFLLTAGLEALAHLREHTAINRAILHTIVLSPLSREQLQNALWSRHKTGGVPLLVDGKAEEALSDKEWRKLFNRLYKSSGGNIGLALCQWQAQIRLTDDGRLELNSVAQPVDFPELEDAQWYFVLLQLYLHKALSHHRFSRLFKSEGRDWVADRISELQKANLLVKHRRDVLELRPVVRYHVGRMLRERGLL